MPKKAGTVRNTPQRQRTRVQKNFALVHPENDELEEQEIEEQHEETITPVATAEEVTQTEQVKSPPKGSAAARLEARRKLAQKSQQRAANSLITAESFKYVQKELLTITILSVVMAVAIVVLYLVFGQTV